MRTGGARELKYLVSSRNEAHHRSLGFRGQGKKYSVTALEKLLFVGRLNG
jgi:hypothetical protein